MKVFVTHYTYSALSVLCVAGEKYQKLPNPALVYTCFGDVTVDIIFQYLLGLTELLQLNCATVTQIYSTNDTTDKKYKWLHAAVSVNILAFIPRCLRLEI